ncbi:hypothetical protein G7Y89_g12258 [Cudoniella acicularis]|uniref:CMP/dCMP-type deaminase domain-containing protein n=1 Tax=Cudoniella acicularis TaxID=354080 RepID=A0A8H4VX69_9HELO|nr:hypothetical protein G7Y89_g12258 [Cudoniella acicularis]
MNDQEGFAVAVEEAKQGYREGGVPIGAALVSKDGALLGRGHNMRVQKGSAIHHWKTQAVYLPRLIKAQLCSQPLILLSSNNSTLTYFSTGACILYGISRVVIGENKTFLGGEAYLKQRGVEVVVLESKECQDLMEKFICEKPEIWNEDIGEEQRVHSKESK